MNGRQAILAALLTVVGAVAARSADYVLTPGAGSTVSFESKAPVESFSGKTQTVRGLFRADLDSLAGEIEVSVEVDLASLDTGIGLRNRHMRENHIETGLFPHAVFHGARILEAEPAALAPGGVCEVVVAGELDLHGVVKPLTCRVRLALSPDGVLSIATEFPVRLSDHAIARPGFLMMKLADEQRVSLRLEARAAAGTAP
jgi:polyisoprenoid-binding protein YceI